MSLPIAEFSIRRERDVALVAQRGRLLATMLGLESRRCVNYRKAIAEVAKQTWKAGGGSVQFAIETIDSLPYVQASITSNSTRVTAASDAEVGPPAARVDAESFAKVSANGSAGSHNGSIAVQSLVEQFEQTTDEKGVVSTRLRLKLSGDYTQLTENDVADWAATLKSNTTQSALATSQKRLRQLAHELSTIQHQRRDLEAELRQSRSMNETLTLLSLVASKTDNAVIIIDEKGGISWVNDAFTRMTGYVLPEVTGWSLVDVLVGGRTSSNRVRSLRQAFELGHGTTEEFLHYRKDGNTAWLSLNLTPIHGDNGSISRWIGIGSDVTRSHQAQDALAAAKEAAESASRAKSEFLANMSHEIRTPMNAILGMTELALCTELSKEQREYLLTVKDSGDALLQLLNDILDLSKIEAGKMEIDAVRFNLADLIRDTLKTMAVRAHEKGLELVWHVPPEIQQELKGDPLRIRQVLINLIGNAIKFTFHGEISVNVERQWDTESEVGLHFRVADSGIGIPVDKLERIFEAFTQADGSTARQFGGTGLGLTISSELIHLMHGRIWVHSEVGAGSQFHFSLRLRISDEPSAPVLPMALEAVVGKHVLIVDDNKTNRRIVRERLLSWKMHPEEADSADAALAALTRAVAQQQPVDLVIMDAAMPGKDGFQLMLELNAQPAIQCGTVMMLSSADRHADAQVCRELGIKAYLTKPISPSTMLDAIRTALGEDEPILSANGLVSDRKLAATKLRILIADDHPANRRLASRILEKRGHESVAANNGREVLELLDKQQFDLVLLDVQMPEMDGFQTTAAIRERERETGKHMPLIALTAHAMKGDRERCLSAGMDAYLSKPLQTRELVAVVETLGTSNVPGMFSQQSERGDSALWDFGPASERLDNDDELLREQMEFFLVDGPELVTRVFAAVKQQSGEELRLSAHRLKGLAKAYDAEAAADLALKLEFMGQDANFEGATVLAEQLSAKVEALVAAMRSYLGSGSGC
ncbi:MAG: response regulator [Planctomycetota bacterium]|nr:response regulator [Planctomycetota bacterium]